MVIGSATPAADDEYKEGDNATHPRPAQHTRHRGKIRMR